MSDNTKEPKLPHLSAAADSDSPPARKRAAKNAAAKKVAAKKVAAKKAAVKKVAAKKSAPTPEVSAPAAVQTSDAAAPKKRTTRAKKTLDAAPAASEPIRHEPAQAVSTHAQAPADSHSEPRRFGRVPGGGPRVARESSSAISAPPNPPVQTERPPAPRDADERPQHDGQQRNFQNREGQNREGQNRDGQQPVSRSKRRRDKRKRRNNDRQPQGNGQAQPQAHGGYRPEPQAARREGQTFQEREPREPREPRERPSHEPRERPSQQPTGPKIEANGMLELAPKGFGFLRVPGKNFEQARDDVFVTPESIRKYNLRVGQWIHGLYQEGPRGPQMVEITSINGMTPEDAAKLPHFDELKAINPARRISFETTPERFTTRVVDIMAPVGRGQRGLIVSPPRSGKTTLLLHMAEAIREKYDEAIHLMVLLVDERPEEVTEFRRALPGAEIYASSNDEQPRNHCRIAELAIERAKRLVEAGQDVFLLMDSITRLARAYNNNMGNSRGRGTGSGGITIGALEVPRRLFAAARNTRGGGSLTILATALIQTNSRADEAIYMEFKGTGNMELVLDRKIAENYIYPAVDIFKSGTRREELLLPEHMLHKIHLIRRGLSGHRPVEAMERLLFFLKKFPNNPQMLLEIKG
jgi:transcription termination factor Rho